MSKPAKKGLELGRLSQVAQIAVAKPVQPPDAEIAIDRIFSKKQVRKKFSNLQELADSFKLNGVIEPLVVHEEADGRFRIIVGERRYRAAPLAGLEKLPVIIKRGLTELEIRRLQVSENNDRDDLTAFEEAAGVIEDVELYGTKEAMKIWNRGEAWISKRMAVKRYSAPVAELLEAELCGDFEVLHSLNQLHELHSEEFAAMVARFKAGTPVSREDVRSKVTSVKEWVERRKAQQREVPPGPVAGAGGAVAGVEEDRRDEADAGVVQVSQEKRGSSKAAAAPAPAQPQGKRQPAKGSGRKPLELASTRVAVIGTGERIGDAFNDLLVELNELDLDLNEGEWVLWQSFVAVMGPVVAKLGKSRAQQYLARMSKEIKGQDASASMAVLIEALGVDKVSPADMPPGWTF